MEFIAENTDDLKAIAKDVLKIYHPYKIFALYGNMGAGKTTFIKALCEELNVIDTVNSPTFAIINEYVTQSNESIYHFDCYRLKNIKEFFDIGGEDYFYSNNYCFIEWPQIIENILPDNCINIFIETDNANSSRIIKIQNNAPNY